MSAPVNKFYHPGACRLVDAYFRLNVAWWVYFIAIGRYSLSIGQDFVDLSVSFWFARIVLLLTLYTWLRSLIGFVLLFSFRRYFGIVITHFQAAIYTARRDEMVDVVQATLFYMNPDAPIPVHSAYSALPYQVRNIIVVFIMFRVFLGDHMHSSIRFWCYFN